MVSYTTEDMSKVDNLTKRLKNVITLLSLVQGIVEEITFCQGYAILYVKDTARFVRQYGEIIHALS